MAEPVLRSVPDRPRWVEFSLAEAATRSRARQPFLVEQLVSATVTLIYGEPLSGKSTVAAALAAAAVRGERFLGRAISRPVDRVIVLTTEVDGVDEYGRRLVEDAGLPVSSSVTILDTASIRHHDEWVELHEQLRPTDRDLVILDNLTGIVHGSINDDAAVRPVFEGLRLFTASGAAVVVVAHVSEKTSERGRSTKPMGTTAISAGARWRVRVIDRTGDLELVCDGNAAPGLTMKLRRGVKLTDLEVVSEESAAEVMARRRTRNDTQGDRYANIADWVVANHATATPAELSRTLAIQFPDLTRAKNPARELAKHLAGGRGVGGFLQQTEGRWQRRSRDGA